MPTATARRRSFTIRPEAHKSITCARCQRKMRSGERATSILEPGRATMQHAGRWCPPLEVDRHPFLR